MATPAQAGYGGSITPPPTEISSETSPALEKEEKNVKKDESERKAALQAQLDGKAAQIVLIIATIYALFAEDLRLLMGKGVDGPINALTMVVFVLFSAELALTIYINKREKCGCPPIDNWFYTLLDAIATLSLIFDFWFVQEALKDEKSVTVETDVSGEAAAADPTVARASRAARAGTRIGRLLKLTRLLRVSKILRMCAKSRVGVKDMEEAQPTDMARKMAETVTGKVIMIVLVMLFVLPFLEPEASDEFPTLGLNTVAYGSIATVDNGTIYVDEAEWAKLQGDYVKHAADECDCSRVIRVECKYKNSSDTAVTLQKTWQHSDYATIMDEARDDFISQFAASAHCEAWWDDTSEIRLDARLSMARTLLVVFMLGAGSVLFGRDAEMLSNRITIPLSFLSEDMERVAEFDMEDLEPFDSNVHEVNIMQRSFHKMKSGLISFKKFMPEMVVRNLLKAGRTMGLGVERKYLTIFFSNIANFEKVSSEMDDTLVMMEFLSDYFGTMAKVIEETNGTLIEFVGDEILALWNAPVDVVSHEATCVASALQMQATIKERFETEWKKNKWPWIDVKMGINSANVFVGNLGAPDRMKYGVLGDGVNMAARLQMLNRRYNTDVMVSQAVMDSEAVGERIRTRLLDVVAVKGKTEGVRVYECLGFKDDAPTQKLHECIIERYSAAFNLYLNRKFTEALAGFEDLQAALASDFQAPPDRATEVLIKRVKQFIDNPPGEDWDGVDKVKSKAG